MVNDLDGNGIDQGDTVDYSFEVTNTGNTTLSNVSIDDATIGVTGLVVSPSMLAPGAVGTATASYTLTQSDIDNGGIENVAISTGTPSDSMGTPIDIDGDGDAT